jgi:hypothetical protein
VKLKNITRGIAAMSTVALIGWGGVASATAVPMPDRDAGGSIPNAKGAVTNWHLGKGAVYGDNLGPGMVQWFTTVYNGSVHEIGLDADLKAKVNDTRTTVLAASATPADIAKIGGPIAANGTKLSIDLVAPAGKYLVNLGGQIDRKVTAATPDKQTQPQLSLWRDADNDGVFEWQAGEGSISPNATIPDTKDRSVTVAGQTVITLEAETHLKVIAFGYNNDTSAAGGGELAVSDATLVLTPLR